MKKILIIEDDSYIVEFLSYSLSDLPYDIKTARDGADGLGILEKEKQDLVIMDVMLPRLNAVQICQELEKDESTKTIPKIVITASESRTWEEKLKPFHIQALLKKPIHPDDLKKTIADILSAGHVKEGK